MLYEVKLNTLEGSIVTVDGLPTTTIRELKNMLFEQKFCKDYIDCKNFKAQILMDGMLADDDQTLASAGVLHDNINATVVCSKTEIEAANAKTIPIEGFFK